MRSAIVIIRQSQSVQVPVCRMIVQIALDSCFEGSHKPFCLAIRLRMIRSSELVLKVHDTAYILEELCYKALSVVCLEVSWRSINQSPVNYECSCDFCG